MSVLNENQLLGSSGAGGAYNLTDSLRFRESASAYLERTPAVAGNLKTWTWSGWVKRGNVAASTYYCLFGVDGVTPTNRTEITFSANAIFIYEQVTTATISLTTTGLFRDPSAWYHIVVAIDTTQATSTNRVKLYVNGEQITSFSSATYPSLNYNTFVNSTNTHVTGARRYSNGTINKYFDGYLTEINLIDGQALTPSDFGEYDAITGVWQPARYTGTYGTNGFYLPMNQTVETYDATYLSVAGGGGGGGDQGGGGGAGGLLTGTTSLIPNEVYTATVGAGGAGTTSVNNKGSNGQNSSLIGSGVSITSIGGGGGGSNGGSGPVRPGANGGSGGGGGGTGGASYPGGTGTAGQGNNGGYPSSPGYYAGGGGGAGANGANGANGVPAAGGIGLQSSITGTATYYAGGAGGGTQGTTGGAGGLGGGGRGGGSSSFSLAGTANTGGGGGGGRGPSQLGKAGGSGIVILRVPTAKYTGTVTGSPTVTTDGSDTVIKFTASGSYTA